MAWDIADKWGGDTKPRYQGNIVYKKVMDSESALGPAATWQTGNINPKSFFELCTMRVGQISCLLLLFPFRSCSAAHVLLWDLRVQSLFLGSDHWALAVFKDRLQPGDVLKRKSGVSALGQAGRGRVVIESMTLTEGMEVELGSWAPLVTVLALSVASCLLAFASCLTPWIRCSLHR